MDSDSDIDARLEEMFEGCEEEQTQNDCVTDSHEHENSDFLEDSKSEKKKHFRWTVKSSRLLATIRLKKEKLFARPPCKKNKLWQNLAREMERIGGYQVTADECDSKFRNMMQTFKKNKSKSKSSGEEAIRWPFFRLFDEALSKKISIDPPENILGSNIVTENHEEAEEVGDTLEKSNLKREMKDWRKKYFYEKLEEKRLERRRKEKEWEEKKELEKEKLNVLSGLTDALSKYNSLKEMELN